MALMACDSSATHAVVSHCKASQTFSDEQFTLYTPQIGPPIIWLKPCDDPFLLDSEMPKALEALLSQSVILLMVLGLQVDWREKLLD